MKNTATLIVLFNLKKDVKVEEYETFAKTIDSPTIKRLKSNINFSIYKGVSLFGTDEQSPYQYIEIMEVTNFEELAEDIEQQNVQDMLSKFMSFADNPKLITTQKLA